METTSKGAHYYRRTTLCNELGLTDGPLNKQADFSSITGVLVVCPSPGKRWVRPLYNHPPPPIPDELAHTLAKLRAHLPPGRGRLLHKLA
ncbi:TPA: hypothetical protein ACH3X1_005056 [Trebouxia sp. C0004]